MTIKNLAIIMDGNGRWAKQNKLPIKLGHSEGVKTLKKIVKESVKQNFKSLTQYLLLVLKIGEGHPWK